MGKRVERMGWEKYLADLTIGCSLPVSFFASAVWYKVSPDRDKYGQGTHSAGEGIRDVVDGVAKGVHGLADDALVGCVDVGCGHVVWWVDGRVGGSVAISIAVDEFIRARGGNVIAKSDGRRPEKEGE